MQELVFPKERIRILGPTNSAQPRFFIKQLAKRRFPLESNYNKINIDPQTL